MRILTQSDARANLGPEEVALRLEAETLWQAYQDAHKAYAKVFDELWNARQSELEVLKAKQEAELNAFEEAINADPSLTVLKDAKDSAWKAWDDCPLGELETISDDDGNEIPERCVVSGLVISEDDQTVFTGDWRDKPALRGALGLPLIPDEEDENDEAAA